MIRGTKISQYSLNGEFIANYDSIKTAGQQTGLSVQSISRCCTGARKSYHGYIWIRERDMGNLPSLLAFHKSNITNLENEVWRDIEGFEGSYQISSLGRVKSLKRAVNVGQGIRHIKEHILSCEIDKNGYHRVQLRINQTSKHRLVHRLVCQAFIANPNAYLEVNHKNGIKDDNRVENLEWCTRSENEQHAYDTGLAKGQEGHLRPMAKPVRLIHSETERVLEFGCIADCARYIGGKQRNVEAAIRWRATGKIKKLLNGYKVEFIA